jgi:hypothetical protein
MAFDSFRLMWHYTAAQGVLGIAVIDMFPRVFA